MDLWQHFDAWQQKFDGDALVSWMKEHTEIPVIFVTAYLALVFYGRELMANREPYKFKLLFTSWNFILAVFSILGCVHTMPTLLEHLSTKGLYYTVCTNPDEWYFNGSAGFWTAAFILSKIPELMDTVFLVFQKKPVIFLHWYHHATVMLYCWHAYTNTVGPGIWFAAMNYFVHSIMYSYYFLMNLSNFTRLLVRPIAKTITTLQLLQMIVGMTMTVLAFIWVNSDGSCYVERSNIRMGLIMYSSYFVLFASLFKKLYLTKGGKHAKSSKIQPDEGICNAATAAMDTLRQGEKRKSA
jgi:elongation of very long chain fatty acids protein 6